MYSFGLIVPYNRHCPDPERIAASREPGSSRIAQPDSTNEFRLPDLKVSLPYFAAVCLSIPRALAIAYGVSPLAARLAIFWRSSIPSLGLPILMPLAFARAMPALVRALIFCASTDWAPATAHGVWRDLPLLHRTAPFNRQRVGAEYPMAGASCPLPVCGTFLEPCGCCSNSEAFVLIMLKRLS
jgi:hypothetical protein